MKLRISSLIANADSKAKSAAEVCPLQNVNIFNHSAKDFFLSNGLMCEESAPNVCAEYLLIFKEEIKPRS